jgi:glycerol-3-phosphate acyltransferase PlsY
MLELGVKVLLAYLLGSVSGSLLVGQLRGGVDIRKLGSGNAGGTNALRTQGFQFAFWVMVIDIGKGVLAAAWLPSANLPLASVDPTIDRTWLTVACAGAVVAGHVYPLWYGFRGGKGAATLLGVLAGLDAIALVPVLGVWLLVVMLTGYVGLATMLAVAAFPVYVLIVGGPDAAPLLTFGVAMAAFVCYTHRGNIARMHAGEENRARRLWLLRPR